MEKEIELTEECIKDIFEGEDIEKPIVQVLGIVREHYRGYVEISDGTFRTTALVNNAEKTAEKLIHSRELQRNDVVVLEHYMCNKENTTRGKWCSLIIFKMSILQKGVVVGEQIGNPIPVPKELRLKKRDMFEKYLMSRTGTPQTLPIVALKPTNNHWCIKARVTKKGDIQKRYSEDSLNTNLSNSSNSMLVTACKVVRRKFYDMSCKFHDFMAQIARKGVIPISSEELYCLDLSDGVLAIYYIFHYLFHYVFGIFYDLMVRILKQEEFLSVELTDSSGSITAIAYNSACLKFYDVLEVDKVFLISQFNIQRDETPTKFKLILKADSEISPAYENIQFNFCPPNSYKDLAADALVDILGVCVDVSDLANVETESRKRKIRQVYLKNGDGLITVYLFDDAAEKFEISTTPVVAIKGARIEDRCGFKFAIVEHVSQIFLNPDIEEARRVKSRYKIDMKARKLRSRASPPS
ncbi:uncharacterized protein LOC135839264 isoform X2 [Planococcus citri]|uniref:uncharacterized protein LOC135839264 isoform X2 n=1 Tax=Planococcus citri TaxID=170843 RepID=UPI0031F7D826